MPGSLSDKLSIPTHRPYTIWEFQAMNMNERFFSPPRYELLDVYDANALYRFCIFNEDIHPYGFRYNATIGKLKCGDCFLEVVGKISNKFDILEFNKEVEALRAQRLQETEYEMLYAKLVSLYFSKKKQIHFFYKIPWYSFKLLSSCLKLIDIWTMRSNADIGFGYPSFWLHEFIEKKKYNCFVTNQYSYPGSPIKHWRHYILRKCFNYIIETANTEDDDFEKFCEQIYCYGIERVDLEHFEIKKLLKKNFDFHF